MADTPDTDTDTDTGEPPATGDPDQLGDAGKKALDAERARARAAEKRARELEAALKQREDAEKSDLERTTEALSEWQERATRAETEALRRRIASDKGLPSDMFEFLTGSDEDTVVQQADKLAERLAAANQPPPPGGRPRHYESGNGDPSPDTGESPADLANRVAAHRDGL